LPCKQFVAQFLQEPYSHQSDNVRIATVIDPEGKEIIPGAEMIAVH
jgi:hypothetical protein